MHTLALERTLTERDHARLTRLLHSEPAGANAVDMAGILDWARLVTPQEVAPDVVTMYSQVVLGFLGGRQKKLTLCYPDDARPSEGFVSVLSPVGASLLGLRAGESARWRTPLGEDGAAEVLVVLFQPEASGDYSL